MNRRVRGAGRLALALIRGDDPRHHSARVWERSPPGSSSTFLLRIPVRDRVRRLGWVAVSIWQADSPTAALVWASNSKLPHSLPSRFDVAMVGDGSSGSSHDRLATPRAHRTAGARCQSRPSGSQFPTDTNGRMGKSWPIQSGLCSLLRAGKCNRLRQLSQKVFPGPKTRRRAFGVANGRWQIRYKASRASKFFFASVPGPSLPPGPCVPFWGRGRVLGHTPGRMGGALIAVAKTFFPWPRIAKPSGHSDSSMGHR